MPRRPITIGLVMIFLLFPSIAGAAAASPAISRRDGFLLLWNSIRRATDHTGEKPFEDVPKDSAGFDEITYAKARGILDDDDADFHPDQPLSLADALLWLFRTRSVDDLKNLTPVQVPSLVKKYESGALLNEIKTVTPVETKRGTVKRTETTFEVKTQNVTENQLLDLMRSLDATLAQQVHEVSLYAEQFHGQGTAFGETFDMNALTAAHRTYPYNTLVRVTDVETKKSVVVRINDRGPYVEGRDMDLSLAAFTTLAPRGQGTLRATFERLGDSALVGSCSQAPLYQTRLTKTIRFTTGIPHILQLGQTLDLSAEKSFVVRSVTYPDGNQSSVEDWVLPGEKYTLKPSVDGDYSIELGSPQGRRRTYDMHVVICG